MKHWARLALRASEIRSLTRSSFDLECNPPTVAVAAAYSKRRRQDRQPLRPSLADELRPFLANLAPAAPAFKMPAAGHQARMLRADLEAAGIPYRDEADRVADFHALRHSYITHLGRTGAHAKTVQELARHSTPILTGRYTHGFKGDDVAAVNALPDLSIPDGHKQRATGTDDAKAGDERWAPCWAQHGVSEASSVGAGGHGGGDDRASGAHEKAASRGLKAASKHGNGDHAQLGRGGFEPPTHGFSVRCARNGTDPQSSTYESDEKNSAFCLALLAEKSPDLALIVERWDDLPCAVRAGIMAMVRAAAEGGSQ